MGNYDDQYWEQLAKEAQAEQEFKQTPNYLLIHSSNADKYTKQLLENLMEQIEQLEERVKKLSREV